MSSYEIRQPDADIDAVLNIARENEDHGVTNYRGMTYEQGVADGIEWACGLGGDEPPLP
jgi:hypothetical protein